MLVNKCFCAVRKCWSTNAAVVVSGNAGQQMLLGGIHICESAFLLEWHFSRVPFSPIRESVILPPHSMTRRVPLCHSRPSTIPTIIWHNATLAQPPEKLAYERVIASTTSSILHRARNISDCCVHGNVVYVGMVSKL